MIIIIMGVSGVGKTTIGKQLAAELHIPFYEGDDFHSSANITKMQQGIPLTDDDRRSWLLALHDLIEHLHNHRQSAVIACSALKNAYRDILQGNLGDVQFVFLQGNYDLIHQRLQHRQNHFMPAALLQSQFDTLEPPAGSLTIAVNDSPDAIVQTIKERLQLSH